MVFIRKKIRSIIRRKIRYIVNELEDLFEFINIIATVITIVAIVLGVIASFGSEEVRWILIRTSIVGVVVFVIGYIIDKIRDGDAGISEIAGYACTAFVVAAVITTTIFFGNYECREVDRTEQPVSNVAIYDEIIECDNLYIPRKGTKIIYASEETIVKIEQYTEVKSIFGEEISRKTNRVLHFPTTETQKT